ncbi:glycosyltransferase family 2 protein [Pseudonocardia sp. GCM10023141]|uniref:glycosyltransferase family 2 protein n=1 Tax=Pseudonocardia sp. GCM10023141 TaxID=3252653 RepID=UPI00362310D1
MGSTGRRPTVSVVVPCYRYGRYVTQTVQSVLRNEHVDIDVLVIDDASPDDSWSVVEALPRLDPRIRVVRHEQNRGLIATANEGLQQAEGDYVVLLSADDALAPCWLDRGIDLLERTPAASFALGPVRVFEGDLLPTVRKLRDVKSVVYPGRDWLAMSCRRGVTNARSPEVIVRNTAQRAAGGYNPNVPYSSDMEMWLRLASIGDVVEVSGPWAAFYRVHGQNMSQEPSRHWTGQLQSDSTAFDEWRKSAGESVPGIDELMATARRALARTALRWAPQAFLQDTEGFEELCEFALEKDRTWAAPEVEKLRRFYHRGLTTGLRDSALPLTMKAVRARRSVPQLRARVTSYLTPLNHRLGPLPDRLSRVAARAREVAKSKVAGQ